MAKATPLVPGQMYHIYNRGNNGDDLFQAPAHYDHFMVLYVHYIRPIAETYAFCCLVNHFHLLVRIRDESELCRYFTHFHRLSDNAKSRRISQSFANFFCAYAKSVNLHRPRTGALFERPFHRIPILDERYAATVFDYIHANPVHHGFVKQPHEWPWSSLSAQTDGGVVNGKLPECGQRSPLSIEDFA